MKLSLIVAMDQQRGIGIENALPWRLSTDMAFFKKKTTETYRPETQHAVVMGRLTWESLPASFRPLPHRHNIVVSRQLDYSVPEDVTLVHDLSLLEASITNVSEKQAIEDVFIIGGAQLYTWAIQQEMCETLYITRVHASFTCDAFFPAFEHLYERVACSDLHEEKGLSFTFETFRRK